MATTSPAGAQEAVERPIATHDTAAGAMPLARDTRLVIDHPDTVVTGAGEGDRDDFPCFRGDALWYKIRLSGPVAIIGSGQDVAVFTPEGDARDVQDHDDLDPVACLSDVSSEPLDAEFFEDERDDPGLRTYFIAVSADGGVLPWTIVRPVDLLVTVECQTDGTADRTFTTLNLSDKTASFKLHVSAVGSDEPPVSATFTSDARSVATFGDTSTHEGRFSAYLYDFDGFPVAGSDHAVDCVANQAPNDHLTDATLVERELSISVLHAVTSLGLEAIRYAGAGPGEVHSECFDQGSPSIWYSFIADSTLTGLSGSDDQKVAVFRSPVAEPESIADLQRITCGQPEGLPSFQTSPGERIWVAVSEGYGPAIVVVGNNFAAPDPTPSCGFLGGTSVRIGTLDQAKTIELALTAAGGQVVAFRTVELVPSSHHGAVHLAYLPDGEVRLTTTDVATGEPFVPDQIFELSCESRAQRSPEVSHQLSCIGATGRIDTTVVGSGFSGATYRVEFQGLTPRQRTLESQAWWRLPITGRSDGTYEVRVFRNGQLASQKRLTVDCDESPSLTNEVTFVAACQDGRGYVLALLVNPTSEPRGYVIGFEGVPNRSQTVLPYGIGVRSVTGRPSGDYDMFVRVGGQIIAEQTVRVRC